MVETQECSGPVHLGAPLQTGQVWGSQEWDSDCTCAEMEASLYLNMVIGCGHVWDKIESH